jgi:alkyldihydroxyacetonephosphate synthase
MAGYTAASRFVDELRSTLGPDKVRTDPQAVKSHACDLWPRGFLETPTGLPDVVVEPSSESDVLAVLELAAESGIAVVPYGGGSGVCGAVVDGPGHISLDSKRLDWLEIDEGSMTVTVGAGVLGEALERQLTSARPPLTAGHFPASLAISTVGGWIGTASSGQESTRYGSIADIVIELRVASPDGRIHRIQGEEIAAFVGSEGTLGVVTQAKLRLHRKPSVWRFESWSWEGLAPAIGAMESLMRAGLTPNIVRLYDSVDALLSLKFSSHNGGFGSIEARLLRHGRALGRALHLAGRTGLLQPVIVVATGGISAEAVDRELEEIREVMARAGGRAMGEELSRRWYGHRYRFDASYLRKVFEAGAFVNTLDFWAPWESLERLYERTIGAISPYALAMAHISHLTRDGACLYVTYLGAHPDRRLAKGLYDAARDAALEAALECGASIAHQHGIGLEKLRYFEESDRKRHARLRELKALYDPHRIMNPAKLGL